MLAIVIGLIAAVANTADLLFLDFFGPWIVIAYALCSFVSVGLVLALLRPSHSVGWLFLVSGGCFALWFTLSAYSWRALVDAPGALPIGELTFWIGSWILIPALGSVLVGFLLFPTGRPPSRRWVPILVAVVATLAALMTVRAFVPAPIVLPSPFSAPGDAHPAGDGRSDPATLPTLPNPFGAGGALGDVLLASSPFVEAARLPLLLLVLAAVLLRFARSSGVERLQLKWFFYATSLSLALIIAGFTGPKGAFADLAWASGMAAMGLAPVAACVAILRYRLYDIDLLINRTLVYGALTTTLALAYFASVAVLQTALRPLIGESELAVAGSTLAVVALFSPVRSRIQRAVDRYFYRSRYDAQRTVEAFAAGLRDEVDLDSIRADLLEVVGETLRPVHTSVWLRGSRHPR